MNLVHLKLEPVADGAAGDPGLLAVLGPGDLERIGTLGFAADRDRTVTARAAARTELGRWLGVRPRLVPLVAPDITGGPALVRGSNIAVSWSHSGAWVAIALARRLPVGIDIEEVPERTPVKALARMGVRSLEEFVAREAVGKLSGGGLAGTWPPGVTVRWPPAPEGYLLGVAALEADWSVAQIPRGSDDPPAPASAVAAGLWPIRPRLPGLPLAGDRA